MPLREETNNLAGKTEKTPVPDQSWWEEFGEWESASNVSHLYALQAVTNATQPRLLIDDHVVRLPVARPAAKLSYDSFPQLSKLIQRSLSEDEEYAYSPRALGPVPDWGVISEVWVPGRLFDSHNHAHVACDCNNAVGSLVIPMLKAVQHGCKVCLGTYRQTQLHYAACALTTCSSLPIGIGSSHLDSLT